MTDDRDWDDLVVSWGTADLDAGALSVRVQGKLRRQAGLMRAAVLAGAVGTIAGLALAAWTIYVGLTVGAPNFLVRGTAVLLLSLMLGMGTAWLAGTLNDATRSLADMLDLSIRRARVFRRLIGLGFAGTAIAAVLGMVGYAVRTSAGNPPAMSPVEPLLMLGLFAVALLPFHLRVGDSLARLQLMRRALESEA